MDTELSSQTQGQPDQEAKVRSETKKKFSEPVHKGQIPILSFPLKRPMTITMASSDPPILLIRGFLRKRECKWLREMAEPMLKPSTAVENDQLVIRNYRNSWTAHITISGEEPKEPILHSILTRVSAFSGMPMSHIEGINVVRYRYAEKYEAHHDYFAKKHSQIAGKGGERIMTFFVYLNDVPDDAGGATIFPKLNFCIQPRAGTCAFWMNTDPTATIYYDTTFHSGEEIRKEGVVKYGMNIWVRQNPMI